MVKSISRLLILMFFLSSSTFACRFSDDVAIVISITQPYKSPTERHFGCDTPCSIRHIMQAMGSDLVPWSFWQAIIDQEERGFFGYHAAKQEVRIFQDVVRAIFEEILHIEMKKEFNFFRIPLHPTLGNFISAREFLIYHEGDIDDGITSHRDQILSLNYTLFGNFAFDSQSTVNYFSKNRSWFKIDYKGMLAFLFEVLGIPIEQMEPLFAVGCELLKQPYGVVYQFFDLSSPSYSLVDQLCYPSYVAGKPDLSIEESLSVVFQKIGAKKFDVKSRQLRFLFNSRVSLNPYTSIYIRRYDLVDIEIVKRYEDELRREVRNLFYDPCSAEIYKNKLLECWCVNE